jgi:hypothetical protein
VDDALPRAAGVSIVARVVRQFEAAHELVTLGKAIALPALPTMGARLDLRSHGVEAPLEVVSVTLKSEVGRSAGYRDLPRLRTTGLVRARPRGRLARERVDITQT